MFRDDHEAALARIAALEAELERERAGDAAKSRRLAQLEQQLDEARRKLLATQAELVKHRLGPVFEQFFASNSPKGGSTTGAQEDAPKAGSTTVARDQPDSPKWSGSNAGAIIVAVLLVAAVAVGLLIVLGARS